MSKGKWKKPKSGTCRICGCTDDHACTDFEPCHWVDPEHTLCSACDGTPADLSYALRRITRLRHSQPKLALTEAVSVAKSAMARFDERNRRMLSALELRHAERRRPRRRAA